MTQKALNRTREEIQKDLEGYYQLKGEVTPEELMIELLLDIRDLLTK